MLTRNEHRAPESIVWTAGPFGFIVAAQRRAMPGPSGKPPPLSISGTPHKIVIVINLACEQAHPFEGWFRSSDDFASQNDRGLVNCPVCGSHAITRKPSAPYVNTGAVMPAAGPEPGSTGTSQVPAATRHQILQALRALAAGAEDVGERFTEEVRRVHYGESEERSLRGRASRDEVEELLDEGIAVLPVPPPDDPLH